MFKRLMILAVAAFAIAGPAMAADQATPEEAKAMAEKAAEYVKANGLDAAIKAFNEGSNGFRDRDLYVFALDHEGTNVAHGANPKLVGKNLMKVKDPNGVQLVAEIVKTGANDGTGWVEYSWVNPESKKVEPKVSYVIGLPEIVIGVGAYK